jgi:hypothetical protein
MTGRHGVSQHLPLDIQRQLFNDRLNWRNYFFNSSGEAVEERRLEDYSFDLAFSKRGRNVLILTPITYERRLFTGDGLYFMFSLRSC